MMLALEDLLIRSCISADAADAFRSGDLSQQTLQRYATTISELSRAYTAEQAPLSLSELSAKAYALYYTPINAAKVAALLALLPQRLRTEPRSLLDFGCGPGTATVAAILSGLQLSEVVLVDRSQEMLTLAEKLVQGAHRIRAETTNPAVPHAKLSLSTGPTLDPISTRTFDIVIAAHSLNEFEQSAASNLAGQLWSMLSPTGVLVLLEPALRPATRRLMAIRDQLVEHHPDLKILYPCTHRNLCPMLAETDGWCHAALHWQAPRITQALDQILGFNKHRIKFSALIATKDRSLPSPAGLRIVEEPVDSKVGTNLQVCGATYFGPLTLRRRERNADNRSVRRCQMHDRIVLETFNPSPTQQFLPREAVVSTFPGPRFSGHSHPG